MRIAFAILAVALLSASTHGATDSSAADGGPAIVSKTVKVRSAGSGEFTLYVRLPDGGVKPQGVLCLCLLQGGEEAVRAQLRGRGSIAEATRLVEYAQRKNFAVAAWGVRHLWDSRANWNEMGKDRARALDDSFDAMADAWARAMNDLQVRHNLPANGYVMWGLSGGGQFALRLALRRPERFAAVHAHVPSSFDLPTEKGKSVLWCLTTGENETGYRRSLEFLSVARKKGYAIVYRAYPGRGHVSMASAEALGLKCYEYALERHAKSKGKADFAAEFKQAAFVADVVNLKVFPVEDAACVPPAFRLPLPAELRESWLVE